MKKLSILLLLVLVVFTGCSLNEYAVKKSIQAGANVGIIAYDISDMEQPENITYIVARNFLAEGYSVKALNTISSRYKYPFLKDLFEGQLELNFKTKIESLMKYTTELQTPFEKEGQIKRELEEIKGIVGMDYLVTVYKQDNVYSLVGIDIGNYEVVYVHHYRYTPFWGVQHLVNLFRPYSSEKDLNATIKKFITTIQEVGSMEEYSPW
jgi:hypothetical protein